MFICDNAKGPSPSRLYVALTKISPASTVIVLFVTVCSL